MTIIQILEKRLKENGTLTELDFKYAYTYHKSEIVKAWEFGKNHGKNEKQNEINPHWSFKKDSGEEYYDWEFNYKYGK
jgi:hypothetical protein